MLLSLCSWLRFPCGCCPRGCNHSYHCQPYLPDSSSHGPAFEVKLEIDSFFFMPNLDQMTKYTAGFLLYFVLCFSS